METTNKVMKILYRKRFATSRPNPFLVSIITLVTLIFCATTIHAAEAPFYPGEKLTFRLKWNHIPAGTVVLEVLPMETIDGEKFYHFAMTAKTNSFVDRIYKVRNRIDSFTDKNLTRSILYKKNETEGKARSDSIVTFDWQEKEARYSNFGKLRSPIPILPGTFDPFSIFYYVRLADIKENSEIKRPVTDGKKCIIGKAKIVKKTKIKLKGNKYNTYLIEPELKHIGGVFSKSKKAKIKLWVTADKRRIPVKIKSKVKIGSFTGTLISAENLAGEKVPADIVAGR